MAYLRRDGRNRNWIESYRRCSEDQARLLRHGSRQGFSFASSRFLRNSRFVMGSDNSRFVWDQRGERRRHKRLLRQTTKWHMDSRSFEIYRRNDGTRAERMPSATPSRNNDGGKNILVNKGASYARRKRRSTLLEREVRARRDAAARSFSARSRLITFVLVSPTPA